MLGPRRRLWYVVDRMALSRRQFFRRLVNSGERSLQERLNRYTALESYVRTHLLPYDFGVTDQQLSELIADVRTNLETATDEDLFSSRIYGLVDSIADNEIQPWREAYYLEDGNRDR